MSIIVVLAVALVLGMLVGFALLLGGYWEAPAQLKEQILALGRSKPQPAATFRAWVESDLGGEADLQAWLLSLSEEGFAVLTQRVVKFLADLNIQLSWLVDRHVDAAPPLKQAVRAVAVDYLRVCQEAIRHQESIGLFGKYHKLVTQLADVRYREPRRSLFTKLVAAGLAEPLPAYELIMASETQRQALAAKAIQEAAAKDWGAFAPLLQATLAELAAGAPA